MEDFELTVRGHQAKGISRLLVLGGKIADRSGHRYDNPRYTLVHSIRNTV